MLKNKKFGFVLLFALVALVTVFTPDLALADLEGSLRNIKGQLTGVVLPLLAVIAVALASISFFSGHPNSKQHIIYAILGTIFAFGAQSLVDFIQSTVR